MAIGMVKKAAPSKIIQPRYGVKRSSTAQQTGKEETRKRISPFGKRALISCQNGKAQRVLNWERKLEGSDPVMVVSVNEIMLILT